MRAIDLAEAIINSLPEGDPRAEKLWLKHDNLTADLLDHRRMET